MNDDMVLEWRSLMEKGTEFLGQGNYSKAEEYYIRSFKLAQRLADPVITAFNIRLLATTRIKQGKIVLAERGFQEALEICRVLQNEKGISEALAGLASVAVARENMEEAASWYERAIEIYPLSSPRLRLSMLYSDLGQVYLALQNWSKAHYAFTQARELCHIYGFRKGEGELSILLAEVSYRQHEVQAARTDLIRASKLFVEAQDEESLVNAIQYLAFIDFEEGNLERARESWQRVVALYLRLAHWEDVSESAYFLAKILQDLNELTEAVDYLELSIHVYRREDLGLGLRFQSLGELHTMRLNDDAASASYKKAAAVFELYGDAQELGEIYEKTAVCLERIGEAEEAKIYYTMAKTSLENFKRVSMSASHRLAEHFENGRNYFYALQYYWKSLEIARDLGADTMEIERAIQRTSKKVRKKNK